MARILVADDQSDIRDFVRAVLEQSGHTVMEAGSGSRALEMLKRDKPDLLILDVMLPGMDGHTVQLSLSGDPSLSRLPVIVITALDVAKDMFDKFPQVKCFLPKPFTAQQVEEAVRKLVPSPALWGDPERLP